MRAVIDIGSNTIRLCIFKVKPTGLELIFTKKEAAGLVQYYDDYQNLTSEGILKCIEIINSFKLILDSVNLSSIHTFATASIRNATNRDYVISRLTSASNLDIKLLSDTEEASYAYQGALKSTEISQGIMIDLGGGSTEIVIYKNGDIIFETSIPLGSLNSYNKYVKKLFPNKKEAKKIKKELLSYLKEIDYQHLDVKFEQICGVGGSCRAALKLVNKKFSLPVFNTAFDVEAIDYLLSDLAEDKYQSLHKILKIVPDRVHTIIPGLIIIKTISEYFDCSLLLISNHGVREGYLWSLVEGDNYE